MTPKKKKQEEVARCLDAGPAVLDAGEAWKLLEASEDKALAVFSAVVLVLTVALVV